MAFNVTVIYLNGVKEYLRNIIKVTSEHGFWVLETRGIRNLRLKSKKKKTLNFKITKRIYHEPLNVNII